MKTIYITVVVILFSINLQAQNASFEWLAEVESGDSDRGNSITVDGNGNVLTIGVFQGTVDADPGAGVLNLNSVGLTDIFIQKLDADKNLLWAKSLGGTDIDYGQEIARDANGNIFVTGYFRGTMDLNPDAGVQNETALGESDVFILKLDANGNFLWAKTIGGTDLDDVSGIAVDANGSVFVSGIFQGTADFDPSAGTTMLTAAQWDSYILKLDTNGNFLWVKHLGGSDIDNISSLTLDINGDIYGTGSFRNTVDFDPGAGVFDLVSPSFNIFIWKLDNNGNFVWAKQVGSDTDNDYAYDVTIDINGNILTTGQYSGTSDFDPSAGIYNLTAMNYNDIFVLKLDPNGDFLWAKGMGGTSVSEDVGHDIDTDANGNVYTVGYFLETVDFDPSAAVYNITSIGGRDIFIQKLDANGNFIWAEGLGSTNSDYGLSIALDGNSNIYTTGHFRGTTDFDPGAAIYNGAAFGNADAFILKWSECPAGIYSDTQSACDSYIWIDGNTYTSSNNTATYTITGGAANGCDSIITLNLSIFNTSVGTDTQTACDSYTWIDGNTYTSNNNTATYTLVGGAASGCDSIITLALTINSVTDITTNVNGPVISANNNNATYQWLDCANNFSPISGETNQNFTATTNGNYAVEITENGCTDISACVLINTVSLHNPSLETAVNLYPNPTKGQYTISFKSQLNNLELRIVDIHGKQIFFSTYEETNLINLDLQQAAGIYFIELKTPKGKETLRLIKL